MTVEVTSSPSRSKRRKLPRRNIIDYEYVAPTKNTNLEHNLELVPSARLRSVLSEVWGSQTTTLQVNQPIVIHQRHHEEKPLKQEHTSKLPGTKSLLDKWKELENKTEPLDLSQLVIIPPSKQQQQRHHDIVNKKEMTLLNTVNKNVHNTEKEEDEEEEEEEGEEEEEEEEEPTSIYNQQQQQKTNSSSTTTTTTATTSSSSSPPSLSISEPMDLDHDTINNDSLKHHGTTPSSPLVISDEDEHLDNSNNNCNNKEMGTTTKKMAHKLSNNANTILLSEGPFEASPTPSPPPPPLPPHHHHHQRGGKKVKQGSKQKGDTIDSPIIVDDVEDIYMTAEEEMDDDDGDIINNGKSRDKIMTSNKTDDVHMENKNSMQHKKSLLQHHQPHPKHALFISPNSRIINKWKNKKHKAKHSMLAMLKKSTALDWIENGQDMDSRKRNVGKVRKQQLEKKLNKPFLERKQIITTAWSIGSLKRKKKKRYTHSGDVN